MPPWELVGSKIRMLQVIENPNKNKTLDQSVICLSQLMVDSCSLIDGLKHLCPYLLMPNYPAIFFNYIFF